MNILIAHNFSDFSYADTSRQLAIQLAAAGHSVVFFSHTTPLETPAVKGLTILTWPEKRPTGLASFKAVYAAMKAQKTDVLLAHAAGLNMAGLAARLLGVKKRIGYYHTAFEANFVDNQLNAITSWLQRKRKSYFYQCYHQMICVSAFAAHDIHKWFGYPLKKTLVITNALQDRFAENELKTTLANQPIKFLSLGRLDPGKNTIAMAKGFCAFAEKKPGTALLQIAGSGPLEAEIVAISEQNAAVQYVGQLPYHQIDHYIKAADVVVCSTLAEAFGMTIIEAMMHATPIMVSAVGGPAELVKDQETGWLVIGSEPQDWQAAFEQVYKLISSQPETYTLMKKCARQTFLAHYQQPMQIAKLEQLLTGKT